MAFPIQIRQYFVLIFQSPIYNIVWAHCTGGVWTGCVNRDSFSNQIFNGGHKSQCLCVYICQTTHRHIHKSCHIRFWSDSTETYGMPFSQHFAILKVWFGRQFVGYLSSLSFIHQEQQLRNVKVACFCAHIWNFNKQNHWFLCIENRYSLI